jgi:hypothetical protein
VFFLEVGMEERFEDEVDVSWCIGNGVVVL